MLSSRLSPVSKNRNLLQNCNCSGPGEKDPNSRYLLVRSMRKYLKFGNFHLVAEKEQEIYCHEAIWPYYTKTSTIDPVLCNCRRQKPAARMRTEHTGPGPGTNRKDCHEKS